MNALDYAQQRYTCKAYDSQKKIDQHTFEQLLECLRLTPSSINIQPWQYLIATSDDAKHRITQAMQGHNAHNIAKVQDASHVLVFCGYRTLEQAHLDKVLLAEKNAGRFLDDESFKKRKQLCQLYIQEYANAPEVLSTWIKEQLHIALGQLLLSAQIIGVQATAIGGFDPVLLDESLGLPNKNLNSVMIVSLGYASDNDFNRQLPKARLAPQEIFHYL